MPASPPKIGGIIAQSPDHVSLIFPLKHTEVFAQISGNLSRVEIKQSFENPLTQPMEAVYTFPLPDEAAVDQMEIKIGDRTIKGDIKKREEAQQIYQTAKQQGRTAGLLEQQRDNIFTQSLANIKPGEEIEVITPAIKEAQSLGIAVSGPYPGDTMFDATALESVDAFIAMYHDQGLAPFKFVTFGGGVNVTLGLPVIRTSVDHGTALDIAGSGIADSGSMLQALRLAYQLAMNQRRHPQ
jgi:hypothetical protein